MDTAALFEQRAARGDRVPLGRAANRVDSHDKTAHMEKEATARIKINTPPESAGWRFFVVGVAPANIWLESHNSIKSVDLYSENHAHKLGFTSSQPSSISTPQPRNLRWRFLLRVWRIRGVLLPDRERGAPTALRYKS